MPYPNLITPTGCADSVLLDEEHAFVSEFLAALNERVRVSAANAGVQFFSKGLAAFEGSGICQTKPDTSSMNVANLNPTGGGWLDRITPTNWLHGSLHPTPAGHRRVADLLAAELPPDLADMPRNPAPDKGAAFRLHNVGGATPALYNPDGLLRPAGIACDAKAPTIPFATRLRVFNERLPLVIDADPSQLVCYTGADGFWKVGLPSAGGDVSLEDGVVRVKPYPLGSRAAPQEQRIVYRDTDGNWRIRLVAFCSTIPNCASGQGEFIKQQIGNGARELAIPVLLIFAGGWLVSVALAGIAGRALALARGDGE